MVERVFVRGEPEHISRHKMQEMHAAMPFSEFELRLLLSLREHKEFRKLHSEFLKDSDYDATVREGMSNIAVRRQILAAAGREKDSNIEDGVQVGKDFDDAFRFLEREAAYHRERAKRKKGWQVASFTKEMQAHYAEKAAAQAKKIRDDLAGADAAGVQRYEREILERHTARRFVMERVKRLVDAGLLVPDRLGLMLVGGSRVRNHIRHFVTQRLKQS